ncbi:phosphatidylinositol N-acetylglucosaminyltransferase subunit C [Aethina tumida]|uniref:phosphatidylinositol N-acetylglucosaminyltransferase subunit C n=1 Tax=Aethina tumida TaxID=116153 RepID=UPI00096AE41E|nr:phosphatidylinositol N-acetylglucosaminyltransferase subunit C [Aethina tumida]
MTFRRQWKKILYENQGYPDNYSDKEVFLRELKKNIEYKEISLFKAISGATILVQEICNVVTFVLVYFYMVNEWAKPNLILSWSSGLTTVGFCWYLVIHSKKVKEKIGNDFRTVLTFLVFGQLFSPVLHTLTDTISTDTIYTMTFLMTIIHLIFFDYGVSAAVVSSSVSLSAAVFASICLASRLSSAYEAFILLTVSTEIFVLFPILRTELGNNKYITAVMFVIDLHYLLECSGLFAIIFLSVIALANLLCPLLFVKYQIFKENIYGPWDEAIVDDIDSVYFT